MTGRLIILCLAMLLASRAPAADVEIDPATGFRMTGDWELVRANCIACHSAKLVTQQRGGEAHWLHLIRWMQATQNLWQFDPEVERKIVAYLAENYPPSEDRRRAALPPELMPPNPYAPPTTEFSEKAASP